MTQFQLSSIAQLLMWNSECDVEFTLTPVWMHLLNQSSQQAELKSQDWGPPLVQRGSAIWG